MLMEILGPLPCVQIIQVSSFSSVLINRFHCSNFNMHMPLKVFLSLSVLHSYTPVEERIVKF